jgi:hypothetical protein
MFMPCTAALVFRKGEHMLHSAVSCLTTCLLVSALVGLGSASAVVAQSHPSGHGRHPLVGSWLVTYDVEAFGVVIPILLSFGRDGVVIETDSPAPTPVGPLGTLILSNGHGAWQPRAEQGTFAYLYRKLIYQQDGLTPFGTTKTQATGTISADGTHFEATIVIEFLDTEGQIQLSAPGTATGTRILVDQP